MHELVVISGKGGTGKTSVSASLAVLAEQVVVADCDVDAADLHLVLAPRMQERHDFYSGHEAHIREADCVRCGACYRVCRFDAIVKRNMSDGDIAYGVDPFLCEGCGVCVRFCPQQAIDFPQALCGEWMVSQTRCGPMVHARLKAAAENSGKLVSTVRQQARQIAEQQGAPLILVDGPPGIGCPVIASLSGASQVLVVSEPTVSGVHDLERVLALTRHFQIRTAVCVNKWDLNPYQAGLIEEKAAALGARLVGRIRYDTGVTAAQIAQRAVVETDCPSAEDIRQVWEKLAIRDSVSL